jgi:hypothetical protein
MLCNFVYILRILVSFSYIYFAHLYIRDVQNCKFTIESVRLTCGFRKFNSRFVKEMCKRVTPNTSHIYLIITTKIKFYNFIFLMIRLLLYHHDYCHSRPSMVPIVTVRMIVVAMMALILLINWYVVGLRCSLILLNHTLTISNILFNSLNCLFLLLGLRCSLISWIFIGSTLEEETEI